MSNMIERLGLILGEVLVEPVSEVAGERVRTAFVASGRCPECGIEYLAPPRRQRRDQWKTGRVIEHVYRHCDGCPGGEHKVIDVTYVKEGQS